MTFPEPIFGSKIIKVEQTDSTNSHAARLLHETVPQEGSAILSQFQQAGKGQRGTQWESERGKNLLISYIVYPEFLLPAFQFLLSQATSIAVAETVSEITQLQAEVKWPNDILIGQKKISGILIENSIRSNRITHSIIGIGINLNQVSFSTYYPQATSIKLLTNNMFNVDDCLSRLNKNLDKWYFQLRTGNHARIRDTYNGMLFLKGVRALFEASGKIFHGTIRGVHMDGSLDLEDEAGERLVFRNKEIKLSG